MTLISTSIIPSLYPQKETVEIKKADVEIIELLEEPNKRDRNGKPLLHTAIEKQNIKLIKQIIKSEGDLNISTNTGKPALLVAVKIKNFEIIKLLVDNGANVNITDAEGITPLFEATFCSKIVFDYLLANGADIEHENDYKENAMDWVCRNGSANEFKEFFENGKMKVNFHRVVENDYPICSFDYFCPLTINGKVNDRSALFYALKKNKMEIVKKLISIGANINELDSNSNNLLHQLAMEQSHISVDPYNFLINNGVSPVTLNNKGETPFVVSFQRNVSIDVRNILRKNYTRECSICGEEKELFALKDCGHAFCFECLNYYFETDKIASSFNCPHIKCKTSINPEDIQILVKPETYERIDKLLTEKTCMMMGDFSWCPDCGDGGFTQEVIASDLKHFKVCDLAQCNSCSTQFCNLCMKKLDCSIEEHKLVCDFSISVEEKLRIAKPCPRCKIFIQHDSGCSHMTCHSCRYQFCYICLGPYRPGFHVFNIDGPCFCKN